VASLLGVQPEVAKRVTFTEITRDAILDAFAHPREIDLKLFDAQEARRVLDRLVGYKISPICGAGSGRACRRAGCSRRRAPDRRARTRDPGVRPRRVLTVDVRLAPDGDEHAFLARLVQVPEGKLASSPDKKGIVVSSEADAAGHVERLGRADYRVAKVERKERKRSPAPPFTTSTLQQEAARKLGFGARKTMTIAQRLYEGITLPGEGTVGSSRTCGRTP